MTRIELVERLVGLLAESTKRRRALRNEWGYTKQNKLLVIELWERETIQPLLDEYERQRP
jgi:hypothetical protein